MKYTFQLGDGREAVVRFKHHGKRKGKAPKSTRCRIMVGEDIISEAWARPAAEIGVLPGSTYVLAELAKNPRFLRFIQLTDHQKVAIMRGDQFCRREGRSESFRKALEVMDISHEEKCSFTTEMIGQGAVKS